MGMQPQTNGGLMTDHRAGTGPSDPAGAVSARSGAAPAGLRSAATSVGDTSGRRAAGDGAAGDGAAGDRAAGDRAAGDRGVSTAELMRLASERATRLVRQELQLARIQLT